MAPEEPNKQMDTIVQTERMIDELLAETKPAPEEQVPGNNQLPSQEVCQQRLVVLRNKMMGVSDQLRATSQAYYYLCEVVQGRADLPGASLVLHPRTPDGPDQTTEFARLPLNADSREVVEFMLAQAALAYLQCWKAVKDTADEADRVCEQLTRYSGASELSQELADHQA
jgi:hypothetical protein